MKAINTLKVVKAVRALNEGCEGSQGEERRRHGPPSVQPPGVGTVDAHGDRYRANRAAVVALVAMAEHLSLISSLSLYVYIYIYVFLSLSLFLS